MRTHKILLVEDNPRILEMLVDAFVHRFNTNITCVSTAEDALDVEMLEPHTIAVVDMALRGMDAISLAERLHEFSNRPIILMGHDPTTAEVIEAMRCGVIDVFPKPFEVNDLLDSMERAMARYQRSVRRDKRYQRTRELVKKVIRERRDLNARVELICRDLVGAHKRLVVRMTNRQPDAGITQN
jgi:DNA-binding NtrC family response regulator